MPGCVSQGCPTLWGRCGCRGGEDSGEPGPAGADSVCGSRWDTLQATSSVSLRRWVRTGGTARRAGLGWAHLSRFPSQLLQAGVGNSPEASPSVHRHLFAVGGWVWQRRSFGYCCCLSPYPDGPRLRKSPGTKQSHWTEASAYPDPQPPTTPKETRVWSPYSCLPTPNGFAREATLRLAIYIYNLFTFTSAKIPTCPGSRARLCT